MNDITTAEKGLKRSQLSLGLSPMENTDLDLNLAKTKSQELRLKLSLKSG